MKTLTISRFFPKGHPKQGQPTLFVEQILNSILPRPLSVCLDEFPPAARDYINDFYVIDGTRKKHHTIRAGARFKPGDIVSLRVWENPGGRFVKGNRQIEFAQVEVKKVWTIEINEFWFINNEILEHDKVMELAKNDGLEYDDFVSWFAVHPKKKKDCFTGQVISWSDGITY